MLKITQAPPESIQVRQAFAIAGIADPEDAGKTLTLTIDNQFKTSGSMINSDGSWHSDFVFQQPGDRRLKISVDNDSLDLEIQVISDASRLSFDHFALRLETEELFTLNGKAEGYDDEEELVLMVDKKYVLARPRVKQNKWQASILFYQPGKRLVEIIASEQDRAQIELNVQPGSLQVVPRSFWTDETTPADVPDLIQPKRITIHHTEYPTLSTRSSQAEEAKRLRDIRRFHVDKPPAGRGWSDIGYHFVIMPSGRIYEARSERKRGAHDRVNDGIGISFDGNYSSQKISPAQFESAVDLCTKLFKRYGFGNPTTPVPTPTADFGIKNLPLICGHQDRVATACPGSAAGKTVRLEEIRQAVKSRGGF